MRGKHLLVEEQIKRWRLMQQSSAPSADKEFVPPNIITISGEVGAAGLEIAERVGAVVEIPVYGREIVEHIASTQRLQVASVESLDERAVGRLEDYVIALARERNFDQGDYMRALTRTITALWGHGPCVLAGRGGAYIVSHRHCLAARIIAPLAKRVQRYALRQGLAKAEAADRVQRIDAERRSFIQRFCGQEIDNPLNYDLVLNTAGLPAESAADIIVDAYQKKFK